MSEKLNLGSGRKPRDNYVNADIQPLPGVNVCFDFNVFPYPFADDQFTEIFSDNVLEHLDSIPTVMAELHRISCPNGKLHIIVPYYNCYGAHNDVTHRHTFSHRAFEPFYNNCPGSNYFIAERFALHTLTLIPTRLGKIIPSDRLRLALSFVLGQIYQAIDIQLVVKKNTKES